MFTWSGGTTLTHRRASGGATATTPAFATPTTGNRRPRCERVLNGPTPGSGTRSLVRSWGYDGRGCRGRPGALREDRRAGSRHRRGPHDYRAGTYRSMGRGSDEDVRLPHGRARCHGGPARSGAQGRSQRSRSCRTGRDAHGVVRPVCRRHRDDARLRAGPHAGAAAA